MESFQRTYKSSLAQLKWWSKEEFGDRQRKQNKLIQQLQNIKQNPSKLANGDEIRRIESKLSNILIDEEICWKQRSRADWLKERDKNMKFFHAKASARKRKNKIQGIEDSHERARQRTKKRQRRSLVVTSKTYLDHSAQIKVKYKLHFKKCLLR